MIYPIALPDRLELLVSLGDEQRQLTVPIPETTLCEEVQHFRKLLEKRTTNEYLVPARQLYDQLIHPMEAVRAAHHIDTLVIVPDYTCARSRCGIARQQRLSDGPLCHGDRP